MFERRKYLEEVIEAVQNFGEPSQMTTPEIYQEVALNESRRQILIRDYGSGTKPVDPCSVRMALYNRNKWLKDVLSDRDDVSSVA